MREPLVLLGLPLEQRAVCACYVLGAIFDNGSI
jgi:hypothetical protein